MHGNIELIGYGELPPGMAATHLTSTLIVWLHMRELVISLDVSQRGSICPGACIIVRTSSASSGSALYI